uniref:ribosomal protein L33 n=1 Tax=Glaucosphaera vacuolata TaxID=38265 RepID=UPI001FCD4771|nr:ribosomal protein L33 [Glaucosphaera vacuolata]UNJ18740.1 ribosomal protein L33 [Glaucosphaera vacuolata]
MAKNKGARIIITLECISCRNGNSKPLSHKGVFRYTSQKNRRNTSNRLELKKYCPYCHIHTEFKEIK